MHIREGRLDDIPYLADISCDALWNDDIVQYLAPNRAKYPLSHRDNYLYRTKKRFFGGDRLVVAVTDDEDSEVYVGKEKVIGFAFWSDTLDTSRPHKLPASTFGNGMQNEICPCLWLIVTAFEQLSLRIEGSYRWYFNIDRSYDKLRFARFWDTISRNPFFEDISHYWELELLAIDPDWQRKGVGSMLLSWGLVKASRHHLPVVVAATADGEYLYKKHGFTECGRIGLEDSGFSWVAMVRYQHELPP